MKYVVVYDIDGTIADCSHRLPLIYKDKDKEWDRFHEECINDLPIAGLIDILRILANRSGPGIFVVLCTGRPDSSRALTLEWLARNNILVDTDPVREFVPGQDIKVGKLLMRKNGDYRKDCVIKQEALDKEGYSPETVLCVIDDRTQVVDHFRSIGYTVLQCAKGDY